MEPTVVIEKRAIIGEGPWWDAETQKLWWIDIFSASGQGGELHRFDPLSGEDACWHIGQHIGCAIPMKDGHVLLALQDGVYCFHPGDGMLERLAGVEEGIKNNRLNDGKCDSRGRLWFGSMSMTANQPVEFETTGSFYRMERRGAVKKFLDHVGISNGLAWNADETQLYYIDTPTQCISAFDFDAERGEISNRRTILRIDESEGSPDGMTIDAEGKLWVAHFGGWKVARYDPETGACLTEIRLPCEQVTCCCFGGRELDELYITTASIDLSEEQRKSQPLAGCMFMVKPGVKGTMLCKF